MNTSSSLRSLYCTAAFGLLFCLGISSTRAVVPTVVAPNSAADTEGNIGNAFPFDISLGRLPNQRYQQLFNASEFANIPAGGLITQIIFRPDAEFGAAFKATLPDIQINLSTSNVVDDGLSLTFGDNVGTDETIVFARGSLALSSAFTGPPDGPKDFDIVINLKTPFFYDPRLGNLLLDVRNFGAGSTTSFDAQNTPSDGVSRIFTFSIHDVNSDMADSRDSYGLVTGFTIVPEPRGVAMFLLGGGILLVFVRRRQFSRH